MDKASLVLCLILVLMIGCSSTDRDAPVTDPTRSENATAGVKPITEEPDPEMLGEVVADVDSAAALYDFGDIADFLALRDSLQEKINSIAHDYPSVRNEPEFNQLLKSLSDLDSLGIVKTYASSPLEVTDSLALAIEAWPDIDSTEVIDDNAWVRDDAFPVMENSRIDFWIRYFTGPGKERFARYLYRMELYRPTVNRILDEVGVPRELICVALIESGFNLKARSYARAVGPWQFIAGTARIYGLRVNWWFDERRDIVASTYAAGNYLKDLYGIWSSWPLALASYNCGEYRVARAVAYHKTHDFWKLRLPKQTERYVPKFLAALYILRDPEKYGFAIPDVEPIKFDELMISDATDIKLIAKSAGTTVDVVQDLNPGLLRWSTPPKMKVSVKVPPGTSEICQEKLEAIPVSERVTWRKHKIRQGETLSVIASKYGTSVSALKQLNGIRNAHRIRAGKYLIVPIQGSFSDVASVEPQYKNKHRNIDKAAIEKYAQRYAPPANHKRVIYLVKDRDTLGAIAEEFNTRASKIRRWNNLAYRSYIYPGQKLTIYVPESFDVSAVRATSVPKPDESQYVRSSYTVRRGDTFYSISRRFNVQMMDLLAWNEKSSRSTIYPGQKLEIWQKRN